MRETTFSNIISELEEKRDKIFEEFIDFTDGYRVLMLLQRSKDGGHNEEEKRIFESFTTTNGEEFKEKLLYLLVIKSIKKVPLRIYLSANSRNPNKVIRFVEQSLIDAHYADDTCKESIYKKLLKKPRHFLMQQNCKNESLFIIDVDDIEGVDTSGDALKEIARLGVIERKRYRTKNGWHFVVEPFNCALWDTYGEVKKDPLILLDY
jgi:hypothetical protein